MTDFHEIKVLHTTKNKIIDIIYIHDDFLCYVGEAHPRQTELISTIPVFYPDSKEFEQLAVNDLNFVNKFHNKIATEKGIALAGICIITASSFKILADITNQLIAIARNLDEYTLLHFDNTFTKDESISNLSKLSTILKNISLYHTEYILLWEGI
ncbi:hypothetical protein [Bacillus sp. Au-Bac7]|uniref:hypothetical protein n=1 Tax=Bacillus sp. Au-Bac7 TaxID=2906458 RepID=UPI001E369515|nr:hypothetical protein [Bacillus sp. Au-Bac7]MCE4048649.1 hypothetical protein [Bacillus sp. Au-Bac7]